MFILLEKVEPLLTKIVDKHEHIGQIMDDESQLSDEQSKLASLDYEENLEYVGDEIPLYDDYARDQDIEIVHQKQNYGQYSDQQQAKHYSNKYHRAKIKDLIDDNTRNMKRLQSDSNRLRNTLVNRIKSQERVPQVEYKSNMNTGVDPNQEAKQFQLTSFRLNTKLMNGKPQTPAVYPQHRSNAEFHNRNPFGSELEQPHDDQLSRAQQQFQPHNQVMDGDFYYNSDQPTELKKQQSSGLSDIQIHVPLSRTSPDFHFEKEDKTLLTDKQQQSSLCPSKPFLKVLDLELPSEQQPFCSNGQSSKVPIKKSYDDFVPDISSVDKQWPLEVQEEELKDQKRYLILDQDLRPNKAQIQRETRKSKIGNSPALQGNII